MINLIQELLNLNNNTNNDCFNEIALHILYFIKIYNKELIITYGNYLQFIKDCKFILSNDDLTIILNKINTYNFTFNNETYIDIFFPLLKNIKKYKELYKTYDIITQNYNITDIILKNIEIPKYSRTVISLFSNFGEFDKIYKNNNYEKLFIYNQDKFENNIYYFNKLLTDNVNYKTNIIESNIIYDSKIVYNGDFIICHIPCNLKNILYTNCNNLIKKLKIRGTKAEPLLLQLTLQLLNKNGVAIIITPNSLLFGESIQHVETRKYLLNNYNLLKIIELNNKNSILYIKNEKITNEIEILKNNNINKINKNIINTDTYSLYFNDKVKDDIIQNTYNISDIINIYTKENNIIFNPEQKYLYTYKFNDLTIDFITETTEYNYLFITKDSTILSQDYLNEFMIHYLKKNKQSITKNKMEKISLDLLLKLKIPLINIELQNIIFSQIKLNNTTCLNNQKQIDNYIDIRDSFINNLILNPIKTQKINSIFEITNSLMDNTILCIKKNSLDVGKVDTINNVEYYYNNTNYFYLSFIDKEITNYKYYLYIIKYYYPIIYNASTQNKTYGLNKTFIENIDIPIISKSEEEHLIKVCDKFNDEINNLQNTITKLKEIDLFSVLY